MHPERVSPKLNVHVAQENSTEGKSGRVLQLIERKAKKLVQSSRGQIRFLLLEEEKFIKDVASELIPNECDINPEVAYGIALRAAQKALTADEYQRMAKHNKIRGSAKARMIGSFTKGGDSVQRSIKTRGCRPWTEEEHKKLFTLLDLPEYQHQSGPNAGKPIYAKIAEALNKEFHGGNSVRIQNTVSKYKNDCLNRFDRDQGTERTKRKITEWSSGEVEQLLSLVQTKVYSTGHHVGMPNLLAIAAILNQSYHIDAFESGIKVRTSKDCFAKIARLKEISKKQNSSTELD